MAEQADALTFSQNVVLAASLSALGGLLVPSGVWDMIRRRAEHVSVRCPAVSTGEPLPPPPRTALNQPGQHH